MLVLGKAIAPLATTVTMEVVAYNRDKDVHVVSQQSAHALDLADLAVQLVNLSHNLPRDL